MYLLGIARLDAEKQLFTIGGRAVALQRKPYQVLLYLIENRHRMIYRKELLERFWDGKDVYDQSLSKAVGSIRKAFGESRTSSVYIETRWGLGYRYVGPFGQELPPGEKGAEPEPTASQQDSIVASFRASEADSEEGLVTAYQSSPRLAPSEEAIAKTEALPAQVPLAPALEDFRRRSIGSFLPAALMIAIALAAVALLVHSATRQNSPAAVPANIHSVAVLPFAAATGSSEDEYLGLGLADAVAVRLSTIPQLTVRSSSTVRAILGPDPDLLIAGKKLEVQGLVEGNLRREAGKLVIGVRLVNSSSGANLWSGTFDAYNSNIFTTEDSIAQQVSSALLPELHASGLRQPSVPDTKSPEAYDKYMKAKFFASSRTRTSLDKAIELLNQAIALDPNYARAYAALADCYQLQGFYQFVPPVEAYPRAKSAALKALSIDNTIAEAHASLLSILADYDWDWEGVEREFKATVAIDPNFAVVYQYYGYALLGMGRGDDAIVALRRATELDPVSPSIQASLGWGYFLLRRNREAVEQCNRVLEMYPNFVPVHQLLGMIYSQMGDERRAIEELKRAQTLEADSSVTPILLDYELARTGNGREAVKRLESAVANSRGSSVPDYYLATVWTAVGEKQKAIDALDHAYKTRSNWVIYLRYDSRFDSLREDPRFEAIVERTSREHAAL